MKVNSQLRLIGTLLVAATIGITACEDPFGKCDPGFDCPGDDEGPKSGGSSPGGESSGGNATSGGSESGGIGGTESGGTPNVGGAPSGGQGGEPSGGAPPQPCGGECPEETPICDEGEEGTDDDECVGCLKHTDCDDPTRPMCSLEKTCGRCTDDFSCSDTLGLAETPVCLDGVEDEETGEDADATGECVECATSTDCGEDICDQETHTCLDGLKYRTRGVCVSCENDLECLEGHYCVPQTFGGQPVGSFCMETKASRVGVTGSCSTSDEGPPFVDTRELTSVGDHTEAFCVLRATSCLGYNDHAKLKAACVDAGALSDAACGAQDVNDGLCRQKENDIAFFCTYKCTDDVDCLIGGTQFDCVDNVEPRYCGLSGL